MAEVNETALQRNADKLRAKTAGFTEPDGDPIAFGDISEGQYLRKQGSEIVGGNGPGSGSGAALSTATPQPTGTTGSAGAGEDASPDTHVHALGPHDHSGASGHGGNILASSVTGLATVATTGSYDDLSDRPSLSPDVSDVPFLVTTAQAGLSNEVVVGATPGGELGGTWPSPTVDASHSGSTHAATQAAAEATAATALSAHAAASDPHTGYAKESDLATIATSGLLANAAPAGVDKVLYVSHGGVVSELSLSATVGHVLQSAGAAVAPVFAVAQSLLGENAPSQITSNQNNYTFGGSAARVQRINSNAALTITGFSLSQADGYLLQIVNTGSFVITISHESSSSTTGNRVSTPTSTDYLLFPSFGALFRYSGTASRWLLVAGVMMPMPYLKLSMSAVQSVSNNTLVTISFDTKDKNWLWTPPTLPVTSVTAPYSGMLKVVPFDCDWGTPNNITGYRALAFSVNNGQASRFSAHPANPTTTANTSNTVQSGYHEQQVTAGDTIEIKVRQDSGSTLSPAIKQLTLSYIHVNGDLG